ncbi:MAG: hypothetical protein AMXMBFR13_47650 [Phycisphaerae bacterium]
MAQLEMFTSNIVLILGGLLCLLFSGVILVVLWIGMRVWVFHAGQRLARDEYIRRSRRADGKMYPPRTGGICEACGRVRKVVYHLKSGEKLCHDCYEAWWPTAEREAEGDAAGTCNSGTEA